MKISYLKYGNRFVVAFTLSDMRETIVLFRGLKINIGSYMKCIERIYIGYCLLSNPFHLFMNKICLKLNEMEIRLTFLVAEYFLYVFKYIKAIFEVITSRRIY